ncbi:MAG: hypothetical protein HC918_01185 [Oscillatoriales cyanobacterium SM2_1_8]|nr:hypothetical protein [Oscillatoriales cyanobacterium SM2_1_8]
MEWQLENKILVIRLGRWERLWAFHYGEPLAIPVDKIRAIAPGLPPFDPWLLRAPGTALPWLLTAGTFYSRRGREFGTWLAIARCWYWMWTLFITNAWF